MLLCKNKLRRLFVSTLLGVAFFFFLYLCRRLDVDETRPYTQQIKGALKGWGAIASDLDADYQSRYITGENFAGVQSDSFSDTNTVVGSRNITYASDNDKPNPYNTTAALDSDISLFKNEKKALSTNTLAPKKAKSNKVWVRYTPNPLVVLYTPSPRQSGTRASPSKTPLKTLTEYKDRLLTRDQVEIIKASELAAPATKLASDTRERDARIPKGYPSIIDADYSEKCGIFHGSNRTRIDAYDFSDHNDIDLKNTSTGSIHAIVLLLAGDSAARMGIALVQSLRNVNTCPGIDIVGALAVGGVGSEECKRTGKTKCSSLSPTAFSDVISLTYLKALSSMGVRFRLLPQFVSRTAQIPGGSQTFWGMSFNKLGLFKWTEYKKVMYLDADEMFLKNVDYLLYYPMFTGSMTQCCDRHENMKPSGGLWIIEPSYNLYDMARVFTNEHDMSHDDGYNTGSSEWKFSDMQVISMMFGKARKVDSQAARSLVFPESADSRQNIRALLALWSDERKIRVSNWRPLDNDLALAGPWDLTTMPLDVDEEYWYRASTHDRNHFDDIADRLQMPQERGRVWHALNESYDWVAMQCACIPSHDRGHDWFISVHLTCLTFNKPGQFRTLPELRYAVAGNEPKIPECMKHYLNLWLDLYEQGMGDLKRTIWWQEEDPATTYKGPWD